MQAANVLWWSVVAVVVVVGGEGAFVAESFLCDDIAAICSQYDLPYDQNNTMCESGKVSFLSTDICNCGTNCISYLEEGDACYTQSVSVYPSQLCGPQLYCAPNKENSMDGRCMKNNVMACLNDSALYGNESEAGTLGPGRMRPSCDEFGRYAPRQCSPSATCYCVDEEGKRLFGEASILDYDMDCSCSRYWNDMKSVVNNGEWSGLRCLSNGNFDSLQCIGERCFCYDKTTNSISVGPFPLSSLTELPCFDSSLHFEDYTNPCTRSQALWDSQGGGSMLVIAEKGRPSCSPDGYYEAVQRLGAMVYCADINGNPIENFTATIEKASTMTCNCARRRYIMEENGLGASKPLCCPDGDYYPWQRRGLLAYCVDENGNQFGEVVAGSDIQSLMCYTSTPCT